MKLTARVPVTAGLTALFLLSSTGCARLHANDQINKGVGDFKSARYESATVHFQNAAKIDPDNPNPRIYLAMAYASQVVPGLKSPENDKLAQEALDNFRLVLQKDPQNVIALKQIASIDRSLGKIDESKDFEKQVIAISPEDPEAYDTIGGVDWKITYENALGALKGENLTDKSDGNVKLSKGGCAALTTKNAPLIAEGLQYLQKAVDLNPTYEEAMTYMSLLFRRKADTECGNVDAIKADLTQADMWTQKAMGARKEIERRKEEKSHGVTQ